MRHRWHVPLVMFMLVMGISISCRRHQKSMSVRFVYQYIISLLLLLTTRCHGYREEDLLDLAPSLQENSRLGQL